MSFRTPVLFVLLLLGATSSIFAETYYVSPYGTDFSFGTSPFFPWATIAKVNAANLKSGDQVYFLRGGTWRETLVPQSTGLYYGAYGTGNRPVISGADQLNNLWFPAGQNVWVSYLGNVAPTQVWFKGVLGTQVASAAEVIAPLQWYYCNGQLYMYSTTIPWFSFTGGPGIEASQRNVALSINNVSSITAEHLAFVNSGGVNVCMCSGNSGLGTFNDDVFSGALNEGLSVNSGSAAIEQSELTNNGIGMYFHSGITFTLYDSILSGNFNQALIVANSVLPNFIYNNTITGNSTHNPAAEIVTNKSSSALNMQNSVLLPNPFEPKIFNYSGLTDAGNNVYQSPFFQTRAAPLIVVPFVDDYINLGVAQAVSKLAASYGCHISYALNTKLVTPAAWQQIAQMQAAGNEIVAHTRSHSDLANNNVFSIQYTGTASTATLTINQTTGRLQTFLNGSTTPDLNLDLTNTYNGVIDVLGLIPSGSHYVVSIQPNQNFFTPINLAAVTQASIKTSPYMTQARAQYLTWEVEGAQSDIEANLSGYKPKAFATPYTSSDLTVENHVRDAGFMSNRNGLLTSTSLPDGNWLLSNLDVYNMAAEWLPFAYDATKPASSAGALIEGLGAAGGIMAVYSHGYDEFSLQNWTDFFSTLKQLNGTCMTMSQANAYVEAQGQLVPDGTNKNWTETVPLMPNYSVTTQSPSQGARNLQ